MRLTVGACLVAMLCTTVRAEHHVAPLEPGIYSNEEEVYFDTLAERPAAPWTAIEVTNHPEYYTINFVDAFGKPLMFGPPRPEFAQTSTERVTFTMRDGRTTELRRARPVTCWVAIRKEKPKADGSEDWYFQSGVKLHDQGGRAIVGGGDTGAQAAMIRVRNVTWDKGSTNAPVVSLYVHKPENWDRAESYSWAAPDSARVGINLRWMQTGCAIEGLGQPSKLDTNNFKSNEEAKAK
jgi:hypothetical protein